MPCCLLGTVKLRLTSRISDAPEVFIENPCRSYRPSGDIDLAASKGTFSFLISGVGEATFVGTDTAVGVGIVGGIGDGADFAESGVEETDTGN